MNRRAVIRRFCAVVEVLFAFAATHFLLKAFKQFTDLGARERNAALNFSPGLFFGVAAILTLLVTRRKFGRAGFNAPTLGLKLSFKTAIIAGGALYLCPLVVFIGFDPKLSHALLNYLGFLSAVAFGEEIFFRGYMQSRLNMAFGKPWRIRGISFGAGLLLTSLMFGVLHGLNTVDYFHGNYSFAWGWAGSTAVVGFGFGLLRESRDSVWPAAVVHGLWDVWAIALMRIATGALAR